MPKFILISKGSSSGWDVLSPQEWENVMDDFAKWSVAINEKGKYIHAMSLDAKKSEILGKADQYKVVDGPFAESKEGLTGLFIIEVESLAVAEELAKQCPTLLFDKLEIYQSGV